MLQNKQNNIRPTSVCWKQFSRLGYAVFRSVGREVRIGVLAVSTLAYASAASAAVAIERDSQQPTTSSEQTHELDELEVTGSLAPLQANQAARIVATISREEIAQASAQSINDLLKLIAGIDVRQRGAFGIQADISIDGGTFDQVTILLNGININSPQTGHLSSDFPVPIADIQRIEVLEGAASRTLGGNSFSGAINIVTTPGDSNALRLNAEAGSWGSVAAGASGNLKTESSRHLITGSFTRSDGGTDNSSFSKWQGFYHGTYESQDIGINWQFGVSKQGYGANTFYSAAYPDQYEHNSRLMATVGLTTKTKVQFKPTFYWSRQTDHFELIHNSATGENFHLSNVYGAKLNSHLHWQGGTTSVGAEVRNEDIYSTNLGRPLQADEQKPIHGQSDKRYTNHDNRTNVSAFVEHNILLQNFTISAGVVANMNTAVDKRFRWYPGIDVSYRPTNTLRFFTSWNMAFRMPTFTDLYYKSPTQEGNKGLKPEKTQNVIVAAKYDNKKVDATIRGFYHKGDNMIDWVMYTPDDIFHSANFKLDNIGFELSSNINFSSIYGDNSFLKKIGVAYTHIHQKRHDNTIIYKSNYALEYVRDKLVASIRHKVFSALEASWQFRWQSREGNYLLYRDNKSTGELKRYRPYALLDVKLLWQKPKYSIYLSANNLTNHTYYDHGNIPQPGLCVMAGATFNINL